MPRIPEQKNPLNTPRLLSQAPFGYLADQLSPALYWRHDRDLVTRFEFVIAIDKLHAGGDQNTFVLRAQGGSFYVNLLQQVGDDGSLGKIDIES
jgi:hypothetical protein